MSTSAITSNNISNSPSTSGSWTVSGKSVRKKASGLLREAARSWGRSRSKEVLSFGLGVLIGSPQQQNNHHQQQQPHQPESGSPSPQSTLSSFNRQYRLQDQSPLGILYNSSTPPPRNSQSSNLIKLNTPVRDSLASTPTSTGTIVKGPKKRISFHGTPKLKLKDKQAMKLKRKSEIGFGDWADTLNTAVAASSPNSPPTPMLKLINHSEHHKPASNPLERSLQCKTSMQNLTTFNQTLSLSSSNPLEVEAMNFSCRKANRHSTHIRQLMAATASDTEPTSPTTARVPRSSFPHPHRSPRSPRRIYHTRATAIRNQSFSTQRLPDPTLISTPTVSFPDSGSTRPPCYQQSQPLTSSPFKRSVSPVNQFDDDFDVESPIASKSLGRNPRISGSGRSDYIIRSGLAHSATQSPIKTKPHSSPNIARLKEVSSARANLFGATPNQSGGLEYFMVPQEVSSEDRNIDLLSENNKSKPTSSAAFVSSLGLSVSHQNDSFLAHKLPSFEAQPGNSTSGLHTRQRAFSTTFHDHSPCPKDPLLHSEFDLRHINQENYCPRPSSDAGLLNECHTSTSSVPKSFMGSTRVGSTRKTRPNEDRNDFINDTWTSSRAGAFCSNSQNLTASYIDSSKRFDIDRDEVELRAESSKPNSLTSLSQASSHDFPYHISGSSVASSSFFTNSSTATTLGIDGFGALPPPESPFRPLQNCPTVSSGKGLKVSANSNKLKRDLDGQLVKPNQRSSSAHPPSSAPPLSKLAQKSDEPLRRTHRSSWGLRSLEASEDDEDENGFVSHVDQEPNNGSHESHEGLGNLSVPGLTDSSSLASSLASSNQSNGLFNSYRPRAADCPTLEPDTAWDESGRGAKRRSLPTHVGRMAGMTPNHISFTQVPPLPIRPITSTPPSRQALTQQRSPRNLRCQPVDLPDQTGESSFQSVKPNASAFLSSGMICRKMAARERRESNFGAPSPFLKYALKNFNESNVSGITCQDSSNSVEDSVAIRSMREALGGAHVIDAAVKEDNAIQQRLQQQYEQSLSYQSAQNSFGLNRSSPGVLPPDLCARRPSLSSLRMPDTPIKKPSFLHKAASAYLHPRPSLNSHQSSSNQSITHNSRPFVSSGLSKQSPLFAPSPIDGSPIENSPSCRSFRFHVPDSPLPRLPQSKTGLRNNSGDSKSPEPSRWVMSSGDESGDSPLLSRSAAGMLSNPDSPLSLKKGCDLMIRQSPVYRRKSSDAVLGPKGKACAGEDLKNSGIKSANPFEDPSTPTKLAPGWLKRVPQLLTSPGNSISSVTSSPNSGAIPYRARQQQPTPSSATESPFDTQVTPHRTKSRIYTPFAVSTLIAAETWHDYRSISRADAESSALPQALHCSKSNTSQENFQHHKSFDESQDYPYSPEQPNRFENEFDGVELIGVGEFGEVFKARHAATGKVYAVKKSKKSVTGPRSMTRLYEEVDMLRRITQKEDPSPFIIQLFDAWQDWGTLHIQTEFCTNGTLAEFLDLVAGLQNRVEEERIWKIMSELSQAVVYMHSEGILHLDIKPANVFIDSWGGLKVGDFGLARRWPRINPSDAECCGIYEGKYPLYRLAAKGPMSQDCDDKNSIVPERFLRHEDVPETDERKIMRFKSRSGRFVGFDLEREGDREYIAPETLSGRYGEEADVYAIGLIALEIATSVVLPDNGDEWRGLRTNDFSKINFCDISSEMVFIIKRMLDRSPDRRITIEELVNNPVMCKLGQLRRAGLNLEQQERLGRDDLGDIEMKSNDATVDQDEYEEVKPAVPKDSVWTSSRGAVLPEAKGFLDFILTSADSTPGKKSLKKNTTKRTGQNQDSAGGISKSSCSSTSSGFGSDTNMLEDKIMMDVDQ